MTAILSEAIPSSNELKQAMDFVDEKLDDPNIFVDSDKIQKGIELIERYFEIKFLDWELFIFALIHCYYKSNDSVVFDEFFIMMGRGNGKNGFISPVAWYLSTQYHGVQGYNVDIIANCEDQAKASFEDIYEMLDRTWDKSKKFFYKSKETIQNLKTKSYIKFNTSNAKTKDGKRSACLIFDEIHEYENFDTIKVFTSGFGKRKHSRKFYITTNGSVREGVLDEQLTMASNILNGTNRELGMLPLIYKIDDEKEAANPDMWVKANPSLPYFPELKKEMDKNAIQMKYQEHVKQDFFTKRMNLPKSDREIAVTDYPNIQATNKELPDLTGWSCVVGIDYTKVTDFASVNAHFIRGDERFDINHSWLCLSSSDLDRIKAPWRDWANQKLITLVDDVEIHPDIITDYISLLAETYNIEKIALDNYRYALLTKSLRNIGFDAKENKNVKLVRPSDIMQVSPVIDSCFANGYFNFGNNPVLRWAINNTKKIRSGKKEGTDTGNYYYGKIEGRSRKTDPFMSLVAAMTIEGELNSNSGNSEILPVIIF